MNWAKTNDGLEIYYEIEGNGPTIVFQSGYMGIHDIWNHQIKAIKNSYRCITHDNRGYGLSSKPVDSSFYTTEKNVADLKAVLDAAEVTDSFLLVTHSLGSAAAIAFADKYPHLVKGIIMMGGPTISGGAIEGESHEEMWAAHQTTPSDAANFYKKLGCSEEIALEAGKWQPTVFKNQTRAILHYQPDSNALNLPMPMLVVHGTHDVVSPKEVVYTIVDTFTHARWVELDGLNHFPQIEAPETINKLVHDFYTEISDN
ncbi:alpha/beta fold hydrolase [Oceanobacillus locisalsi]|uniref:Alpha/beta fold hydrolase n=1 Tax=Oceanobacillus locisalsi TaxID=546107 RepID=A0ABW3NI59_9BACI